MGRRGLSLILIALLMTGCSKAVEIPREDITKPEYREPGVYRIRLHGIDEYIAERFSVTDSTIVIEQLSKSDERYRVERETLPVTVPIENVESVSRLEVNEGLTYGFIFGTCAIIGLIIWVSTWDIDSE